DATSPPTAPPIRVAPDKGSTAPAIPVAPDKSFTAAPTTEQGRALRRGIHEPIARVTVDIERDFHFTTAVSAIIGRANTPYALEQASLDGMSAAERGALLREGVETSLLLLGPFCPHVTEELWAQLGHGESLFRERWPEVDPTALIKNEVTVVVQVDGKVRSRLTVDVDAAEADVRRLALADE